MQFGQGCDRAHIPLWLKAKECWCRLEKGAAGFRYLNQASSSAEPCYALKDVDDGEGLRSTLDAMAIVGIAEAEREAVLRTVAAVLHLGNVTFASAPDEGSALSSRGAAEALAACADLLQVWRLPSCSLGNPLVSALVESLP